MIEFAALGVFGFAFLFAWIVAAFASRKSRRAYQLRRNWDQRQFQVWEGE